MKCNKKWIRCVLVVGLIALINSCREKASLLELIATKSLPFPSASAIEFYNNRLYVFGDDAAVLLVVDTALNVVDSLRYRPETVPRISKETKPDIEAAYLQRSHSGMFLVGMGSQSTPQRKSLYAFGLDTLRLIGLSELPRAIRNQFLLKEWNIEGACTVQQTRVFANRANATNRSNQLLFWNGNTVSVASLDLPQTKIPVGVSGLHYIPDQDLLLFTASEEDTPNAVEDGAIGHSYLGWISAISTKTSSQKLSANGWLRLKDFDSAFNGQKIESVCFEPTGRNKLTLYLVADNDDGNSRIFKVALKTASR